MCDVTLMFFGKYAYLYATDSRTIDPLRIAAAIVLNFPTTKLNE